jgi:hypothetical protein
MAKLTASIQNASRSVKGLQKTWVFNRGYWTISKTNNTITIPVKIGSEKAFKALGCKDFNNAGHEAAVFENICTAYKHKWSLSTTEADGNVAAKAAAQANIDGADDIFVIVQSNDGTLKAYGLDYGLWKTTQAQMANDNNAMTAIEFMTREGMEETYSAYYCADSVTPALLDALTV